MNNRPAVEPVRRDLDRPEALIIIAHGGASKGTGPARSLRLTYAWQLMVSRQAVAALRDSCAQVWRLRYRVRGWNGPAADAERDLRWAVREAARLYPDCPVILVGHSMGGRACVYVADEPNVAAVCLLAPWIEARDPAGNLAARPTLIVHGTADRMTDPRVSEATADRVGATFTSIEGDGHFMLRQQARWREVTMTFLQKQVAALSRD